MGYITWNVTEVYNCIKAMQENKFDCIVAVTGRRGLGKSTLAVKIALRDKQFRIKRDVCFSRDDVLKQLATKKKGVIVADEMINVTYNRDFYAEDQKKLIKMLNMYRDHGNLFIACVPSFYDLDKQFRELVKIRIDVIKRGFAIVHTQNQSSYSTDRWDSRVNEKIEQTWQRKGIQKPNFKRLTTYRGVLMSSDLCKRQREIYEKVKEEKRHHLHLVDGDGEEMNEMKIRPNYEYLLGRLLNGTMAWKNIQAGCILNGWLERSIRQGLNDLSKKKYGKPLNELLGTTNLGTTHEDLGTTLLNPKVNTPGQKNENSYRIPPVVPNDD